MSCGEPKSGWAKWLETWQPPPTPMTWAEQAQLVKFLVEKWAQLQDHDRCHYYPEIFLTIAKVVRANLQNYSYPKMLPRAEFEAGCKQFQDEIYGPEIGTPIVPTESNNA